MSIPRLSIPRLPIPRLPIPRLPIPRLPVPRLIACLLVLAASPLRAEECRTDNGPLPDLPRGTIIVPKAHFIRGACSSDPGAPDCARRAYVVQGDTVFLGPERGLLRCIGYLGRGGSYTEGWIAARDIAPDP